ncbi:hypothetical protein Cgig2_029441 [Carnegiea gigantea]|uniref:Uncharacterized protein n=1 Tax=Carnegiea gigantea TaxID=171969 RepID=A0A9Q1Q9B7_9CARY|nr:hypothetical protein Cgig2_029441 [Carnegiea gigantea]
MSEKMGSCQRQRMRIRCEDANEGVRESPNLYWVDDDDDYSGQLESTNNIIIGERKPGITTKDQYQAQLEDQRVDRRSCLSMIRSWQQHTQHGGFSLLPVPQRDHHVFQPNSNNPFLLRHDHLQQHQHLFSDPEDELHFLKLQGAMAYDQPKNPARRIYDSKALEVSEKPIKQFEEGEEDQEYGLPLSLSLQQPLIQRGSNVSSTNISSEISTDHAISSYSSPSNILGNNHHHQLNLDLSISLCGS